MRTLLALLLLTRLAAAAEPAAWRPPAKELAAVQAVIDQVVQLGYPDTKGADLSVGKATVTATFDPGKAPPPLPMRLSKSQMTGAAGGMMVYTFEIEGLHAHLADGSWLLGLRYHLPAVPGLDIAVDGQPLEMATVVAKAAAAHPFSAVTDAAQYLGSFPEDRRAAVAAVLDATVPLTYLLKVRGDDLPPALVALSRAGCAEAPQLAWALAEQRARDYWIQRYWLPAAPPFDPTDAYAWAKAAAMAWAKANPAPAVEAPDQALRRAWHRQFRAWLMNPEASAALLPPAAAQAAAETVDPGDPQKLRPRIEALRAGLDIPAEPAAGAALADRLRAWTPAQGEPEYRVTGNGASMSTVFLTPKSAYEPKRADLDALFALLADDRPSRFHDFAGPRSVGDNAMRAIAQLLARDPRAAIDRGGDRPWTGAERAETARALQAWWKTHRAEELAKPPAASADGK